jgi:2-methylisocitrate lyase-like PEP mutase family enzyme
MSHLFPINLLICGHSGAATTASRLGQPDVAIATLNDFVQSAQMVCSLDPHVPVIADADTGLVTSL